MGEQLPMFLPLATPLYAVSKSSLVAEFWKLTFEIFKAAIYM